VEVLLEALREAYLQVVFPSLLDTAATFLQLSVVVQQFTLEGTRILLAPWLAES
jgi:hypothetical protein